MILSFSQFNPMCNSENLPLLKLIGNASEMIENNEMENLPLCNAHNFSTPDINCDFCTLTAKSLVRTLHTPQSVAQLGDKFSQELILFSNLL